MSAYSVADAKNTLPKLIDKALEGEEVVITRHGKAVVELRPTAVTAHAPAATYAWLRGRRRGRPSVGLTSIQILEQLYESDSR